jgi:hypothetical protein
LRVRVLDSEAEVSDWLGGELPGEEDGDEGACVRQTDSSNAALGSCNL